MSKDAAGNRTGKRNFRRGALFLGFGVCSLIIPLLALAQETVEFRKIEYLPGVQGQPETLRGALRLGPEKIYFTAGGSTVLTIENSSVEYIAAQAEASMRARTADTGTAVLSSVSAVFPPAYPLVFLFHKAEKHLLSIEFVDARGVHQLALFNVRDHSARAVKKILDTRLGLTPEYYREKDQAEEARRRKREADAAPAGEWTAATNTMLGDSQYARVLLERGTYQVLVFERYVGLRPQGMEWAKYRIPLRQVKPDNSPQPGLQPVFKGARLVGFVWDGKKYAFY